MDLNDVDRYDQATREYDALQELVVRQLADAKQTAIEARGKALKFVKTLKAGTTIVRALSGSYYVSDGTDLKLADNVIISAEDAHLEPIEP